MSDEFLQHWRFIGGPLDGLIITVPLSIDVPSEMIWRQAHVAPFHDVIYRCRPLTAVEISDSAGGLPWEHWAFNVAGESEIVDLARTFQKANQDLLKEITSLRQQLAKMPKKKSPKSQG